MNPLTGLAPVPTGSVVAVKIDDTVNGRPQKGVDLADIVYIEQAEGGLSRLVAVFATNKPVVEPVRSVRTSDPELLSQYGAITLVASGGGGQSLPTLKASILNYMIDDFGDKGFSRDNNRNMPYNLQSNLATVTADQPKGNPVQEHRVHLVGHRAGRLRPGRASRPRSAAPPSTSAGMPRPASTSG